MKMSPQLFDKLFFRAYAVAIKQDVESHGLLSCRIQTEYDKICDLYFATIKRQEEIEKVRDGNQRTQVL